MRTSFSKLSLLALPLAALTACQDYEPFDEVEVAQTAAVREFTKNFETRYGKIDPNHTWGFKELTPFVLNSGNQTRTEGGTAPGRTDNVDNNDNQWVETTGLKTKVQIPGWPNVDGYYYTQEAVRSNDPIPDINTEPSGKHPAGDVTDYEIQYVSAWFRTHKIDNPEDYRLKLHLSDFFIQNVSADNDQYSYDEITTLDKAGNKLGKNGENVTSVTNDGGNKDSRLPNVTFVNQTQQPTYGMDWLHFKPIGGSEKVSSDWTHINVFNAGSSNINPEEASSTNWRVIKYVHSSGTEDFACRPSLNTNQDKEFIYDWVLVKLEWDEPDMKDGKTHHRTGYYLAFDWSSETADFKAEGDHYYSNWIVKISPAYLEPESEDTKRIMCEDLGNTFDFDFNDVVFDVAFEQKSGAYEAIVHLKAAGGTMPIWVGIDPKSAYAAEYEAHKMFGFDSSVPVNVGGSSNTDDINYRVTGLTNSNPESINIYVQNNGSIITLTTGHNLGDNYNSDTNNTHSGSGSKPGIGSNNVPQRFCVPTTVQWMQECKFIEVGYPAFPKWVSNENKNKLWYNAIGTSSLIYEYKQLSDHYPYDPDTYIDDNTGGGSGNDFTFNWNSNNQYAGTFTIPSSYFANANSKIVITFTGNFQFQFAMPNGDNDIPYINSDKNKVLTIENANAITALKAGTHNVFNIDYCASPSDMSSSLFEIVCQ